VHGQGGDDCEGAAMKMANGVMKGMMKEEAEIKPAQTAVLINNSRVGGRHAQC
jgi:hypothetical protein